MSVFHRASLNKTRPTRPMEYLASGRRATAAMRRKGATITSSRTTGQVKSSYGRKNTVHNYRMLLLPGPAKHFAQSLPNAALVKFSPVENATLLRMPTPPSLQSVSRRSFGTHKSSSPSLPRIHPSSDRNQVEFDESTLLASASHIRIVLSHDPDMMYRPSDE